MITKVLKRDNKTLVDYDSTKIKNALSKANLKVPVDERISDDEISGIVQYIQSKLDGEVNVEDIQDLVEKQLIYLNKFDLAKEYITYRYKRALVRKANTTDDSILSLLDGMNEEVQRENSNKKAIINSTTRDLVAGEVSKDLTKRLLLPENIVEAHEKGTIHFHKKIVA